MHISVIVPVYNAGPYLRRCVESILSQGFDAFELILVDDGSRDASPAICDEYAAADRRVVALHQENGGELAARAAGVRVAKGEWITFVDADDALESDALQTLWSLTDDAVDVVVLESDADCLAAREEYGCRLLSFRLLAMFDKLYRRELLTEWTITVPRQFKVGGDFLTNLRILAGIRRKVRLSTQRKYVYTVNSATSVQRSHKSSYAYERAVIEEAEKAMQRVEPSQPLSRAFLAWRLVYLAGMMGLRYPIASSDAWLVRLQQDATSCPLTPRERLTLSALRHPSLRLLFVIEKQARLLARRVLRR